MTHKDEFEMNHKDELAFFNALFKADQNGQLNKSVFKKFKQKQTDDSDSDLEERYNFQNDLAKMIATLGFSLALCAMLGCAKSGRVEFEYLALAILGAGGMGIGAYFGVSTIDKIDALDKKKQVENSKNLSNYELLEKLNWKTQEMPAKDYGSITIHKEHGFHETKQYYDLQAILYFADLIHKDAEINKEVEIHNKLFILSQAITHLTKLNVNSNNKNVVEFQKEFNVRMQNLIGTLLDELKPDAKNLAKEFMASNKNVACLPLKMRQNLADTFAQYVKEALK